MHLSFWNSEFLELIFHSKDNHIPWKKKDKNVFLWLLFWRESGRDSEICYFSEFFWKSRKYKILLGYVKNHMYACKIKLLFFFEKKNIWNIAKIFKFNYFSTRNLIIFSRTFFLGLGLILFLFHFTPCPQAPLESSENEKFALRLQKTDIAFVFSRSWIFHINQTTVRRDFLQEMWKHCAKIVIYFYLPFDSFELLM